MTSILAPTLAELPDAVRTALRLLPVGAGTKLRATLPPCVTRLSTVNLRGVVEYEPEEFVITVLAGTPVRDIAAALARHGQFLPFDPLLAGAGATLGGVVATGTNGPGRLRYGGVRDFILAVRFADGTGRLLRAGARVVKNAAGFDLPKFLVGSCGAFGVLAEITLKVFPAPQAELTLRLRVRDPAAAAALMTTAAAARWQPYALDFPPPGDVVLVRLGGPAGALPSLADEILGRWPGEILATDQAAAVWDDLREMRWAHRDGPLCKLALSPSRWPEAQVAVTAAGGRIHVTAAGDAAYASWPAGPARPAAYPRSRARGDRPRRTILRLA